VSRSVRDGSGAIVIGIDFETVFGEDVAAVLPPQDEATRVSPRVRIAGELVLLANLLVDVFGRSRPGSRSDRDVLSATASTFAGIAAR